MTFFGESVTIRLRIEIPNFLRIKRLFSSSWLNNYQNFSDVIAKRPKPIGENIEPMKSEYVNKTQWLCFGYGIMMIMTNEENDWFHKVIRYIHPPALLIWRLAAGFANWLMGWASVF